MIIATELRKGMLVRMDGKYYVVIEATTVSKGNWRSSIQLRLQDFQTGNSIEKRISTDERIDDVVKEVKPAQYLYEDKNNIYFMDMTSYEEISFSKEAVAAQYKYLTPNLEVQLTVCDGQIMGFELPATVQLKVTHTEPGLKTATVTNVYKAAGTETGLTVQVPPFINMDEKIIVDTRTGEYVGRAQK